MDEASAPPTSAVSPAPDAPTPVRERLCPCGATAPSLLPFPGQRPRKCEECGTPLVRRRGEQCGSTFDRALGGALVAGTLGALVWMFAARATGTGAHWVLPVLGALAGGAAWAAAGERGGRVQWAAVAGLFVAAVVGEVLLYRAALLQRLVRMHEDEGASDAAASAAEEFEEMRVAEYLHIELSLGLLAGLAAATVIAWWITRAPAAIVAFERPDAAPD